MSPEEYVKTIKRIEFLMDSVLNSQTEAELSELIANVEAYERRIYPMARVLPSLLQAV